MNWRYWDGVELHLVSGSMIPEWHASAAWTCLLNTERMVVFKYAGSRPTTPDRFAIRIFIREDLLKKEMS